MKWTKEIPTVDGWYWVRSENKKFKSVVYTEDSTANINGGYFKLSDLDFEFYGPLEEPK